jgi:hypothetical protein
LLPHTFGWIVQWLRSASQRVFTVQKALLLMKDGDSMLLNSFVVDMMGLPGHTVKGERDEQINRYEHNNST